MTERSPEKETTIQKLDRYLGEFRRKAMKEIDTALTGHMCLTVNLRDGSLFQRQIVVEEVRR